MDLGTMTLQLDWVCNVEFAGSYVADTEGYWIDEGFSAVELLPGGPAVEIEPIVESGKATLGVGFSASVGRAIHGGADLRIIGALFQRSPLGIVSLAASPITDPGDLEGKTIGVQSVNENIWRVFLSINEISPDSIKTVPVEVDLSPLTSGAIDGWFAFVTDEPNTLWVEGHPPAVLAFSDHGLELYEQLYFVRAADLDDADARARIVGALRGELKGWQRNIADPHIAPALTVEKYGAGLGLSLEACELENHDQIDHCIVTATTDSHGIGYLAPDAVAANLSILEKLGIAISPDAYTNDLVDEIYADGINLLA